MALHLANNSATSTTSRLWLFVCLPIFAAIVFLALIQFVDISTESKIPPADSLKVERVEVLDNGFSIKIRAESAEPLTIAQIQVDGAFWNFSQLPSGALHRLQTAEFNVPFPWVIGETHHLRFITSTGVTFDETIEIAVGSPTPTLERFTHYAILGLFVGLAPVAIGMLFFPALRSLSNNGLEFVLAMTIGMLVYLFIDLTLGGLELAEQASMLFQGSMMIWIPMALTFGALAAFASRERKPASGVRAAILVAVGIGLHNFGEGLAIGASLAVNEIALGTFLIVGFTLHNVTEGVGVVSPLTRDKVKLTLFLGLALLAGLPVVPGIWIGAFTFEPHWAAILFGIGAGAVVHVILEIDRLLSSKIREKVHGRFSPLSTSGYAAGAAIMYATSFVIAA